MQLRRSCGIRHKLLVGPDIDGMPQVAAVGHPEADQVCALSKHVSGDERAVIRQGRAFHVKSTILLFASTFEATTSPPLDTQTASASGFGGLNVRECWSLAARIRKSTDSVLPPATESTPLYSSPIASDENLVIRPNEGLQASGTQCLSRKPEIKLLKQASRRVSPILGPYRRARTPQSSILSLFVDKKAPLQTQ